MKTSTSSDTVCTRTCPQKHASVGSCQRRPPPRPLGPVVIGIVTFQSEGSCSILRPCPLGPAVGAVVVAPVAVAAVVVDDVVAVIAAVVGVVVF